MMKEQFAKWNEAIPLPDGEAIRRAKARWDGIAKPLGGLGKLETAVIRIAGITGSEQVSVRPCAVAVLCADNGVVKEGVTQTDDSVTSVMAGRIAEGRSSVSLMARTAGAEVFAVDMGMRIPAEGLIDLSVGRGTADMAEGPVMSEERASRAVMNGVKLAGMLKEKGFRLIVTGEMGIGNTTTSSAVASVLLGLSAGETAGRGAGLSDEGLARKKAVIRRGIEVNRPDPADAFDTMRKVGGFDLLGLTGLYIGAALNRLPILIDGFQSSVAALAASRLVPKCAAAMLASHCSAEPAAGRVLNELGLSPVLFADFKLGEGTGAVCMLPLFDMALSVYNNSATFSETGIGQYVPQKGDRR